MSTYTLVAKVKDADHGRTALEVGVWTLPYFRDEQVVDEFRWLRVEIECWANGHTSTTAVDLNLEQAKELAAKLTKELSPFSGS